MDCAVEERSGREDKWWLKIRWRRIDLFGIYLLCPPSGCEATSNDPECGWRKGGLLQQPPESGSSRVPSAPDGALPLHPLQRLNLTTGQPPLQLIESLASVRNLILLIQSARNHTPLRTSDHSMSSDLDPTPPSIRRFLKQSNHRGIADGE